MITHNTITLELEDAQMRQIIFYTEKQLATFPETSYIIAQYHQQFIQDNNIGNHNIHPDLLQHLPNHHVEPSTTSTFNSPPAKKPKNRKRPNVWERNGATKRKKQNPPSETATPQSPQTLQPPSLGETLVHNLSTFQLTPQDVQVFTKGLSFAPTPTKPTSELHRQTLRSFDEFAESLRLKYKRAQCTRQRQHHKTINPTTTSEVYRGLKFLLPPNIESPQQRYTGIAHLEKYIDDTKQQVADNLSTICDNTTTNLTRQQRITLANLKRKQQSLTIKPADKNLGIVLMNTDDYIQQCMVQLSDTTTYRLATEYPTMELSVKLLNVITAFKRQLQSFNKRLYTYLASDPRIPQFYGLPKIHKKYSQLPPLRPIISQTQSRLTPSARLIDHILQPLARSYPDYLHNSTSLSLILQDLYIPDNAILVTIDVVSLYPSIPQSECLATIYTETYNHPHLLALDPNLIIQLLHINVNYNYFTFADLIFQQIKGTAMGAAFSPTIANIFMSTIIRNFSNTQTIKPLVITRYIDDIFMVWTDTIDNLRIFLINLNSFHSSLSFTHEFSPTTIDFLDLTIYKGLQFHITNILDTKTFQKQQNLYQYLHFTSTHPRKAFKAIIKGECIRYVRTNTTHETYAATVYLFKLRLQKRGYPQVLVNKTTNTVRYSNRHRYLKHSQIPPSICSTLHLYPPTESI